MTRLAPSIRVFVSPRARVAVQRGSFETQLMQAAVPFMELEHRAISVGEPR